MDNTSLRRHIYTILIIISLGLTAGRILSVETVNFQRLQRWRTEQIDKTLAESRERAVKKRMPEDMTLKKWEGMKPAEREKMLDAETLRKIAEDVEKKRPGLQRDALLCFPFFSANDRSRWCTVRALVEPEMRVPGMPYAIDRAAWEKGYDTIDMVKLDGHYYSSKPPLFPTMVAGVYWVIHKAGFSMADHPFGVVRAILLVVNIPIMLVFLVAVAGLAERLGKRDWDRIFVVAAACFATFLTTFSVTLNNHLPAAMSVAVTLFFAVRMILDARWKIADALILGLFGAFAAINEMPALSFFIAILFAVMLYFPWKTELRKCVGMTAAIFLAAGVVAAGFYGTNYIALKTFTPAYANRHKMDVPERWYNYTYTDQNGKLRNSHWLNPRGMDVGEPSKTWYAFHSLVGHHGIFSLTPVWFLIFPGMYFWIRYGATGEEDKKLRFQLFALMIFALTAVLCVFYMGMRPQDDRNYGGNTAGLRWAFWLIPLWLCAMLPALEKIEKNAVLRWTALALLAFSAISVAYPTWNPWVHPWIYTVLGYK